MGYNEENIVTIASMHITGRAIKIWDDQKSKPTTWTEYKEKFTDRFGDTRIDKPTLFLKVLSRKQNKNEHIRTFCEETYKLGELAGMEEPMLVHSIIRNLDPDKKIHYKLHIGNDFTFKKLNSLTELIDGDNAELQNERCDIDNNSENENTLQQLTEKIDKMAPTIQNITTTTKQFHKVNRFCEFCKRKGHNLEDCFKKAEESVPKTRENIINQNMSQNHMKQTID